MSEPSAKRLCTEECKIVKPKMAAPRVGQLKQIAEVAEVGDKAEDEAADELAAALEALQEWYQKESRQGPVELSEFVAEVVGDEGRHGAGHAYLCTLLGFELDECSDEPQEIQALTNEDVAERLGDEACLQHIYGVHFGGGDHEVAMVGLGVFDDDANQLDVSAYHVLAVVPADSARGKYLDHRLGFRCVGTIEDAAGQCLAVLVHDSLSSAAEQAAEEPPSDDEDDNEEGEEDEEEDETQK